MGESAKGEGKGHGPLLGGVLYAADQSALTTALVLGAAWEILAKVNWPSLTSPTPGANTFTLFSLLPLVSVQMQFVGTSCR